MTTYTFPTLANPAALTEQELRVELERVNHQVLTLVSQLNTLSEQFNAHRSVLMGISSSMARIVVERMKKDKGDVNSIIDEIIRTNIIMVPQGGSGGVH
ncbi:hypothetical protein [Nitrosovibrio sp. Nv4]|uniref:hypothetical protein n=1 Tax=Nitrosovibrio sp. Nv4 TaxID=1945880 RepID=UPI000BD90306|nr:hypothetical protein [Nitrosovibrio sp. Nv4]SOD42302.1 hypothetical protein SAMN06298226_2640 [Nitrosovibrio sp. Nv4]